MARLRTRLAPKGPVPALTPESWAILSERHGYSVRYLADVLIPRAELVLRAAWDVSASANWTAHQIMLIREINGAVVPRFSALSRHRRIARTRLQRHQARADRAALPPDCPADWRSMASDRIDALGRRLATLEEDLAGSLPLQSNTDPLLRDEHGALLQSDALMNRVEPVTALVNTARRTLAMQAPLLAEIYADYCGLVDAEIEARAAAEDDDATGVIAAARARLARGA